MKEVKNRREMKLEFDAVSENEGFARSVAAAFLVDLNPTLEELEDVRIAISEAVTNAVIHAYQEEGGKIIIRCRKTGKKVTVWIRDRGVGMENVQEAMKPFYTTAPQKERSGMGFAFMEAFMDELAVRSTPGKGTTVRMSKTFSGDTDNQEAQPCRKMK